MYNKFLARLFTVQNKKFTIHNITKYEKYYFSKKGKKGKDQNEQKEETINELDYDQFEKNVEKIVESYQHNLDSIKLGKITPKTFQNMYLQLHGSPTPLIDLGQIIPINIQSVQFHPYDQLLKDDILKVLNKDQMNDFQIQEEGESIRISKQNTDTAEQRQKVLKMLKERLQDRKKQINEARRVHTKHLKDNKNKMSEDLFKQGNQEVDRITHEGYKNLERILKEKENTLSY